MRAAAIDGEGGHAAAAGIIDPSNCGGAMKGCATRQVNQIYLAIAGLRSASREVVKVHSHGPAPLAAAIGKLDDAVRRVDEVMEDEAT